MVHVASGVLCAEGLHWRYRRRGPWLLEDVSLALVPGELLRVRGGNGSGKSTLLRLLAGCVRPDRGHVRVSGRVGYLPQLAHPLPPLRTGRLLELLSGRSVPADPSLVVHLGTPADQLSGGTARRLLLDAVLTLPAPILVLDEPASGLDADGLSRLAGVLRDRLVAGTAVVVAEHHPLPLPGGTVIDLGGRSAPSAEVEVVLGGDGTLRGVTARGGALALVVPAEERDGLLQEALAAGWSVLSVSRPR